MGGAGSSGSQSPPLGGGWPGAMSVGSGWMGVSPVEALVHRSCDPSLSEPPYQIHVELAELINKKKANTPREATMAAVRMVNNRNPHVSLLALALIDSLVQSCGYPIHLQVSTKEFLNELVRRFPERPPPFPGPVMQRILELIHSWKEGICATSRWKDDLTNIREMHRLLQYKGYRFRDLPRSNNVTNVENLKSPEELENEDREAQSAKLQELLRRGTPKDLAAAQELMKILAGAEPEAKPDYKAQTLKELNKVEAKVILLNEMLDNVDKVRGETFVQGDVYDQVATSISAATPKIQGWISDAEAHDPDSLSAFLQINDQINNVIQRYEAFKRGDYEAGANPVPPELAGAPAQPSSLIDLLGDETEAPATVATGPGGAGDDLAGLFGPSSQTAPAVPNNPNPNASGASRPSNADIMSMFNAAPPPQAQPAFGGGMAHPRPAMGYNPSSFGMQPNANMMGMGMNAYQQQQQAPQSLFQSSPPQQQQQGYQTPMGGAIMLPGTPQSQLRGNTGASGSRSGTPSLQQLAGTAGTQPNTLGRTAPLTATTSAPAPAPAQATTAQGQQKDPFADLAGLF